ncbi:MAG: MarR family winged helix-turn-helix transcriptional regulator [Geminicoccaceae bacterium]
MTSSCYCTLLRDAARKATAIYDSALIPAGITVAQFRLLRILDRRGPVSLSELGRLTELDRSTIGRNTRLLERMGLVRPAPGTDQRETLVELAPEGRDTLAAAAPLWDGAQARIEASLGADAEERLRSLLRAL